MRNTVPYTDREAVETAFRDIQSTIDVGHVEPGKAIRVVAQKYGIDPAKLEELYINRG